MGKGDKRRPTDVSDREFSNNWCMTFGHKFGESGRCTRCGEFLSKTQPEDIIPNVIRKLNGDKAPSNGL